MRKIVTTVIAYKFEELDDTAKERAITLYRNDNPRLQGQDWYEDIYEDVKSVARILGIEIDHIYFSGFWSQGDGACFEGRYEYPVDSKLNSIPIPKLKLPKNDQDLSDIKNELDRIQQQYPDEPLYAEVSHHSPHYYHELSAQIDTEIEDICEPLRDFMVWIYKKLEAEYDYLQLDESITEAIIANEYEFSKEGVLL